MLLVDTNIIAPLFVRSALSDAVQALHERDSVWQTEPLALIEFSNVLATYERARYVTAAMARECLGRAEAFLQAHLFSVTHEAALKVAVRHRMPGYKWSFRTLEESSRTCRTATSASQP